MRRAGPALAPPRVVPPPRSRALPLPGLRRKLLEHEESTAAAKKKYREALKALEDISAEIHARRCDS